MSLETSIPIERKSPRLKPDSAHNIALLALDQLQDAYEIGFATARAIGGTKARYDSTDLWEYERTLRDKLKHL